MGGRRGATGCPPAGMPALGKGGVGHTGPGHSRVPGTEDVHRAGGARRTRLRPPLVSPTGGSGHPPRLALGPVGCDVAPRTGAGGAERLYLAGTHVPIMVTGRVVAAGRAGPTRAPTPAQAAHQRFSRV